MVVNWMEQLERNAAYHTLWTVYPFSTTLNRTAGRDAGRLFYHLLLPGCGALKR